MKALLFSILTLAFASYKVIGQSGKDSLLVFVGEKIEVREIPKKRVVEHIDTVVKDEDTSYRKSVSVSMDYKFFAKYKILQQVYGSFSADTIEFVAYDHYGAPSFSKYKTVLLYVSNYNDKLIHEKYQYADVYKTKNGRWASGYRVGDYEHAFNKNTTIKPEPVEFEKKVSYNLKRRTKDDIENLFPSPYYKIKRNKAIIVYGNYVEELFELKKNGILKARGIFD
jgi:hypothetical protein